MLNRKIFKFSTTLITLLIILSRHGVIAPAPITSLPICGNSENSETPVRSTTGCLKEDGSDVYGSEKYCINAEKEKIYKDDSNCSEDSLSSGYYIYSCTDANTCIAVANTEEGLGNIEHDSENLLVYQYNNNVLTQLKNNKYFFSNTASRLIRCGKMGEINGKCEIIVNGIFMNPGTDPAKAFAAYPIIIVDSNAATASTAVAGAVYIDHSSIDSDGKYHKIIKCTTTTECSSITPTEEYYFFSSNAGKYIECKEGLCTEVDKVNGFYLNPEAVGSLTDALLKCTGESGDACTKLTATNGDYYLNGGTSKFLIKCTTAGGCVKVDSPSTIGVYIDKGQFDEPNYPNIIKCSSATNCESVVQTSGDVYINGAKTSKDDALLESDGDTFSEKSGEVGYYIDTLKDNKGLIYCTGTGDNCTPVESASITTDKGHGYIQGVASGAKKNAIITYDSLNSKFISTTQSLSSAENHSYFIDGTDSKKYIKCDGSAGGGECAYDDPGSTKIFFTDTIGTIPHTVMCTSDGCTYSEGIQPCLSVTGSGTLTCKIKDNVVLPNTEYCIDSDKKIYLGTGAEGVCELGLGLTSVQLLIKTNNQAGVFGTDDVYVYDCNSSSKVCTLNKQDLGHFESSKLNIKNEDHLFKKVVTAGTKVYYLTKPNELVLCTGAAITTCSSVDKTAGFYVNAAATSTANAIIKCNGTTCELRDGTDGDTYLNQGANKSGGTKNLITCDSTCTESDATASTTYVDSGHPGKLIECNASSECTDNHDTYAGYYVISTTEATNIIQCKTVQGKMECSKTAHGGTDAAPLYYLKGDNPIKKIIKCNGTNKCEEIGNPLKGYYITKIDGNFAVLSCNGTACKAETSITTTCSKAGQVILNGSHFQLCIDSGESVVDIIDNNGTYITAAKYVTITLAAATDFPQSSSEKTITVKVDVEGKVFLLEETSLPTCSADCKNIESGKYCTYVEGGKMKIQKYNGSACEPLSDADKIGAIFGAGVVTAQGTYPAYFNDNYVPEETATDATISYLCTFSDENTLTSCQLVKGFSKIADTSIYCSGWRGDKCGTASKATACAHVEHVENIGIIGDDGEVCFKLIDTDVTLPTAPATGNIIFYNEEPNKYYGIPGSQYTYLSLTATEAIVTNNKDFLSQNIGYQINRSVAGTLTNGLLSCTASTCVVQDAKIGYYFNADKITKDDSPLIKCISTGCTYVDSTANTYYVDAINPTKIIYCDAAKTCESKNHDASTYVPKHYLSIGNRVITCSPNGCFMENSDLKGYFINGANTTGKKLIKCDGSTPCALVDDVNNYSNIVGSLRVIEDTVKMCVAVGCSGSGEVTIEAKNDSPIYRTIQLGSTTNFPGTTASTSISVKIANDGSVILLSEVAVNYDTKIKSKIPETSESEGQIIKFFKEDGEEVSDITSTTQVTEDIVAYQCTYAISDNLKEDGTTAIIALQKPCTRIKGFANLKNGNIVQCNGWRRDGCHLITPKACAAGDEGKLGTGKKICFGESNTVLLPPSTQKTPSYLAFVQEGVNTYYGSVKSNDFSLTFLELTSNSAIAIDPPATEYGTVVTNAQFIVQIGTEFRLYKFTKANSKYELDNENANNGILGFKQIGSNTYIHYTTLTNDASTVLFDCYKGICKKTEGYILVGTDKVYSNVGSTTWVDKSSEMLSNSATAGSANVGKIQLTSTPDLKISYKTQASTESYDFGTNANKFFFGTDTDLQIYKLGVGIVARIVAIPKPDDGYYFIKNNLVIENNGSSSGQLSEASTVETKLVECNNGKCKTVTPAKNYYANPIGNLLIKCTDNTISTCSFDATTGYYIDNKNVLFYCDGTKCERKDEVGYFVNAGDTTTNKYIECTKNKCEAKPAPDASVTCTEGNIGKLVMDEGTEKVCLANGIKVSYSNTGSYMVAYQTGSTYKGFVNKSIYSGMLSVSANAIKLNFENSYSNYCVTNASMAASAKTSDPCTSETQTEVICNVDGVCLPAATTDYLPDSIRNKKEEDASEKEESNSAADIKIECNVLDGKNCEETYYLVDKQNNFSVLEDGVGTLYQCNRNKNEEITCTENFSVGYFIVDGTLGYYCREEASGISCSLLGERIKTSATTCSFVGDIIFNSSSNKLFFCQKGSGATTEAIELNNNNSGNYAIPKSTDMDIFGLGNNQYALITIKDKIITLNNTYKNNLKYVYVNQSQIGKNKLIEKGDTCPKTTGASPTWDNANIVELDCKNGKCDVIPQPS